MEVGVEVGPGRPVEVGVGVEVAGGKPVGVGVTVFVGRLVGVWVGVGLEVGVLVAVCTTWEEAEPSLLTARMTCPWMRGGSRGMKAVLPMPGQAWLPLVSGSMMTLPRGVVWLGSAVVS